MAISVISAADMPDRRPSTSLKEKSMKILIADRHQLFREGLRHIFALSKYNAELIESCDFDDVFSIVNQEPGLNLILLDMTMPGRPWHLALRQVQKLVTSKVHIIVISPSVDWTDVNLAISLGATGFIPKSTSSSVFLSAVDLILAGGTYLPADLLECGASDTTNSTSKYINPQLTRRQIAVLELIKLGWSNREIATNLGIAEGTTKLHVTSILKNLRVKSRTQAALVAMCGHLMPIREFA